MGRLGDGEDLRDPSTSFLLKQLSTMRRFSSSNRSALLTAALGPPPFARSMATAQPAQPAQCQYQQGKQKRAEIDHDGAATSGGRGSMFGRGMVDGGEVGEDGVEIRGRGRGAEGASEAKRCAMGEEMVTEPGGWMLRSSRSLQLGKVRLPDQFHNLSPQVIGG